MKKSLGLRNTGICAVLLISLLQLNGCGNKTKTMPAKEYLAELPEYSDASEYPASFDLRDYGYVTSVKNQGDYGYCWAFAGTTAAESSILSELGTNFVDNPLDLSERHLAWFTKSHIPVEGEENYDSSNSQSGEGHYSSDGLDSSWAESGYTFYSLLAYSTGIGPVSEETAPYVYSADKKFDVDDNLRFSKSYDLEAGYILPDIASDGDDLNTEGINCAKSELLAGHAVAVSFTCDAAYADADRDNSVSRYINVETCAHYTYEDALTNHCVTIVGWDDNYSRENFKSDKAVKWDESGNAAIDESGNYLYEDTETPLPAGDGAWIVKNSWGSEYSTSSDYSTWGIDGTGYFYISYYDQSLEYPITFDFDTSTDGSTYKYTEQYDFLITSSMSPKSDSEKVMTANVFTAEEDMSIKAVGTLCSAENTGLNFEIYLLNDNFSNPTDGTAVASATKECRYAGYYRQTLSEPVAVKKGQAYSVVVTQKSGENYYYEYKESIIGRECLIAMFSGDYYVGIVNRGESFISFEKSGWQDFTEYIAANYDDTGSVAVDNFSIKVFAD